MSSWHQTGDAAFMLEILEDGKPHSTNEIISRSLAERKVGLTPHSRASDLRKRGHNIVCEAKGRENGRARYTYRLVLPAASQSRAAIGSPSIAIARTHTHGDSGRDAAGSASRAAMLDAPFQAGDVDGSPASPAQLSLGLPGSVYRKDAA